MLSKEECKNTMLKMHSDGIIITPKTCKETFYKYGLSAFCITTHFGNINSAKRELSIPITKNRNTKEDAINKINYLYSKYGYFSKVLLESLRIQEEPMVINPKTIVRIWGSFGKMYNELTHIKRSSSGIVKTEKELTNSLVKLNEKYGYVNSWLNAQYGEFSYDPYILRWGSFENACIEAKVNYKPYDKWQAEEAIIEHISLQLNETPEKQKQFPWMKGKNNRSCLRVDAFYPNSNLIIEYNGEQHYRQIPCFHKTEEDFAEAVERDIVKYNLIISNGINLIIHKFSDDLSILQDKLGIIKSNTSGLYHDPF
jgi:hypothetical protein